MYSTWNNARGFLGCVKCELLALTVSDTHKTTSKENSMKRYFRDEICRCSTQK